MEIMLRMRIHKQNPINHAPFKLSEDAMGRVCFIHTLTFCFKMFFFTTCLFPKIMSISNVLERMVVI